MLFCKKCGSIMLPKKEGSKTIFKCHCGYSEGGDSKITEKVIKKEEREFGIADKNAETLPVVNAKCPDCGNTEALNWEIQTRAADEAATQFFRCKKCGHTWREYK
jgi:DNA-directed RNA polymerase subunit M